MERIVNALLQALSRKLGSQIESAYLFGSVAQRTYELGESDVNLLLILSENTSIHDLREAFLPFWAEYGNRLRRAPLIATRKTLARHMLLRPALAHHLATVGQPLLGGSGLLQKLPTPPPLTEQDKYAYLAHEVMLASSAMTPYMFTDEIAKANMVRLRRIARRVFQEPVNPRETAVNLFANIHETIDPIINAFPTDQPWLTTRTATSPLLPGLQATYTKDLDNIALIFSQISALQLGSIGWDKLSQRLAKDYQAIYVTSSTQLRLIHQYETPLDLLFKRSQLTWGVDPLGNLQASPIHQMRQAARLPSDIAIDLLPNAYLTQSDDHLHIIIHDFQNRLLNIQLENELLNRLKLAERYRAPVPVPGREAPPQVRIDAIFRHLNDWADHYIKHMQQAAA
ncbi:MAG: nucleotidyltransferase domain-containing protein [Anaerolineales bacterium]|nr:nucleotidyltransferase domain-containing protein [Anaerolineales bacterium]MCB8966049.1 nucleotidyltransferase domain-containing protein [Ardenticatenaceae bacterium]